MRGRRTIVGLGLMMTVAAGVVALVVVSAPAAQTESDDQASVSAAVASAVHASQPVARVRPHRPGAVKLIAAPSAPPLLYLAPAQPLDRTPDELPVLSLSSPVRASRGPPA